jgi:acyl-CoA synthetase (AMP-forming)/AMP-acid ligase II
MGVLRSRCFDFASHGERPILIDESVSLDAAALAAAIGGAAAMLTARGVVPGDRVAWLGPTSATTVIGILAVQACGAIAVPLNPRHTPPELAHVIDDSDSALVAVDAALADRLGDAVGTRARAAADDIVGRRDVLAPLDADDESTALLVYTSGTTGRSKGVALSWRALVSNMAGIGRAWGLGPDDTCTVMLPLFHVHGLCIGVYAMLLAGATLRLHPRFDPAALVVDIGERGTSVMLGVPTMYVAMLEHLAEHPGDASVLGRARLFTAGSAPLAAATHATFAAATGHAILERYGMTETLITLSNPLVGERRAGTVGMPVPGVEIRIVGDDGELVAPGDTGELHVRGDSLMSGYWRNPSATAAAFAGPWFRTGDLAIADETGRVRIVGRTSTDIVKSGGFKISTREIEDVLRMHPLVGDCAVVGISDPKWGERVTAALATTSKLGLREIVAQLERHCRSHLADYKCPRQWLVLDAVPRNSMGKVEKVALRERIERDYGGDADARRTHSQ